MNQKIDKPWGYEILLTLPNLPYTGKIEHLYAGKRCSLQYHDQKIETLTLIKGEAKLEIENDYGQIEEILMEPYVGYTVKLMKKHRFTGITECDIVEHSTPEIGNTFRIEDDYSRGTETEEERAKR